MLLAFMTSNQIVTVKCKAHTSVEVFIMLELPEMADRFGQLGRGGAAMGRANI
jgi:hypothetical protein